MNVSQVNNGLGNAVTLGKEIPPKNLVPSDILDNRLSFQQTELYETLGLVNNGNLHARRFGIGEIDRMPA
jgi:hypothetical protein